MKTRHVDGTGVAGLRLVNLFVAEVQRFLKLNCTIFPYRNTNSVEYSKVHDGLAEPDLFFAYRG